MEKESSNCTVPDSKRKEGTNTVAFHKLFTYADSTDIILMSIGTIAAICHGLCMPLMSIFFGEVVDSFGKAQNNVDMAHSVSKVSLKIAYLALGAGIAAFLRERQATRIRSLYLKSILKQDVAYFDLEIKAGEVLGRMSGDIMLIQNALGDKVGKFAQLVSTFVGGFVMALIKGWLLTVLLLACIPALVVAGGFMSLFMSKTASRRQNSYLKAAAIVEQTISSIRTVASFTGENKAVADYNDSLKIAYNSDVHEGLASGIGVGAIQFIIFSSYGLAVWFGAKLILDKGYTGGAVINVIFAVIIGSTDLVQASPCLNAIVAGRAAAFKMFETISREPIIDGNNKGKTLEEIQGLIELKDVYFHYPSRPNENIFSGLSLSIRRGETAALVGQSGSGKSTVISLIERFYDPQAGDVFIDGVNLKEFQLKWIREKIGLVSQEPVLFSTSIKDNITFGKNVTTTEAVRAAVELANATKFINELPQGLETLVGERGIQLSGGQKQRIAIARAIIKNPRILLLDEATSALDAESERMVQQALNQIMVNRTTVVVAHRLSTVWNADTIAVIHKGKIVEKGTHLRLLKNPEGAYSQLFRLQEQNNSSDSWSGELSGKQSNQKFVYQQSVSVESPEELGHNSHEKSKEKASRQSLANLNKPEIPVLIVGATCAIVNGIILPVFGILMASMIKTFYEPRHQLMEDSKYWALMFSLLGLISFLVNPARSYFFAVASCNLTRRIRSMCFEKIVSMEVGWFDESENSSGSIGARLSLDAALLRSLVGDALAQLVQDGAATVAGLAFAFAACWQLALVILAMVPLIGLNDKIQSNFTKGYGADTKTMYDEASQVANDAVGSIRTVASFCAEDKVMEMYEQKCEAPLKSGLRRGLINGIGCGIPFALQFCVYATIFYVGARLVEDEKATIHSFFRVFFVLTVTAIAISQTSSFGPMTSISRSANNSIFAILNRKSKINPNEETGVTLDHVNGEIEFQHISFRYPTRPDIWILRDLSLTLHSKKTVALVGESGSGKSTIISLLLRFYDPDSGTITLDGIELRKFKLKWLRQLMGLVSQEPSLFNDTIRANIAYGKEPTATETEIVEASKLANSHEFISGLQQGYSTIVGERGLQLSGGQKQRVAIARAIVKSPKILLLDEATSALDAESERAVQDALDRAMVQRTTIVVAHRLSTIKRADIIAVVKNGTIVEAGNHKSLFSIKDGHYMSLFFGK